MSFKKIIVIMKTKIKIKKILKPKDRVFKHIDLSCLTLFNFIKYKRCRICVKKENSRLGNILYVFPTFYLSKKSKYEDKNKWLYTRQNYLRIVLKVESFVFFFIIIFLFHFIVLNWIKLFSNCFEYLYSRGNRGKLFFNFHILF